MTKHEASTSTDVAKQWVWLAQARKYTKSPFSRPGLTIAVSGVRKEARAFEHCELWWQPAHLTCQPQKKDFTFGLSHKENGTGKENRPAQQSQVSFVASNTWHVACCMSCLSMDSCRLEMNWLQHAQLVFSVR